MRFPALLSLSVLSYCVPHPQYRLFGHKSITYCQTQTWQQLLVPVFLIKLQPAILVKSNGFTRNDSVDVTLPPQMWLLVSIAAVHERIFVVFMVASLFYEFFAIMLFRWAHPEPREQVSFF